MNRQRRTADRAVELGKALGHVQVLSVVEAWGDLDWVCRSCGRRCFNLRKVLEHVHDDHHAGPELGDDQR